MSSRGESFISSLLGKVHNQVFLDAFNHVQNISTNKDYGITKIVKTYFMLPDSDPNVLVGKPVNLIKCSD